MTPQLEKRSYFRINDTVGLHYAVMEEGEVFSPESNDSLATKLAKFDARFNQIENALWQENPTVAQALGLLNVKINTIAAEYAQQSGEPIASYTDTEVNLSGSGIAFNCVDPLPPQTRLLVGVVLKPSNIGLKFTARVVTCEPASDNADEAYWMRIEIEEDNYAATEQLVQHVVQKQSMSKPRGKTP